MGILKKKIYSSLPYWPVTTMYFEIIPKHPRVPSPQVITIPLSLAKTENPSPAPTFVIDLVFSDSTASGLDLQVSSSPWPSCPRRPSPQVKTSNSDVRATIWLVLTATYRYKFRFYALIYCRNWNKKRPKMVYYLLHIQIIVYAMHAVNLRKLQ